MLNKKIKLILALFTSIILMSTMCFATDDVNVTTTTEQVEVTENNEATNTDENTENSSEEQQNITDNTTEIEDNRSKSCW